jgi:LemA protein
MKKSIAIVVGVLIVLLIVPLILFGSYAGRRNEMVRKNEAIKSAWAQVDNVIQRRADLIPI